MAGHPPLDFLIESRICGSINYSKSSRPWSSKTQLQTITLPPRVWLLVWCPVSEMLCWFYTRCNGTRTFQKVANVRWPFFFFLCGQQCFWPFCLISFLLFSWPLTLTEASETCSVLDVLGSFVTSGISRSFAFWDILVEWPSWRGSSLSHVFFICGFYLFIFFLSDISACFMLSGSKWFLGSTGLKLNSALQKMCLTPF